eukprot:TRINITY_DN18854_c0_g1_i1.p1 TRINITY_DN18854_c0_g1~~TRINITY_DN18854_c0_g1_i1.p1  ORF type:complete len:275 (+),score=40.51 TRINITY_DN18854_c0_g1_i1:23-826(+)
MDTVSIRDLVDPKTLNYGGNTLTDKLAKKALMLSKNDDLRISVLKKNAFKDMKEKGLVRKARKTGDLSLDFTLPNAVGEMVDFSIIRKKGPVIVSFQRGTWCPFCSLEIQALTDCLVDIYSLGAQLVIVSPQKPEQQTEMLAENKITFVDILFDSEMKVARQFGLVHKLHSGFTSLYHQLGIDLQKENGGDGDELPLAATYIIDPKGLIRQSFVHEDFMLRMDPVEILAALRTLKENEDWYMLVINFVSTSGFFFFFFLFCFYVFFH